MSAGGPCCPGGSSRSSTSPRPDTGAGEAESGSPWAGGRVRRGHLPRMPSCRQPWSGPYPATRHGVTRATRTDRAQDSRPSGKGDFLLWCDHRAKGSARGNTADPRPGGKPANLTSPPRGPFPLTRRPSQCAERWRDPASFPLLTRQGTLTPAPPPDAGLPFQQAGLSPARPHCRGDQTVLGRRRRQVPSAPEAGGRCRGCCFQFKFSFLILF